ncbi:MAG: UDP-N-acetyl-D-mannosamine dehydrogenase [Rhodospirillales bacterium]|nr:UDP-N-acetyl-D-mannosamine dehydrogenase [Rhodospirillales bacterium]
MTDHAFPKICVIGLGYVGLPTAAVFASRGIEVLGVDTNARTVALINDGRVPIVEPDLDILVKGAVAAGKLSASTSPDTADAFIIAVPTPFTEGKKPDLSYVKAAVESLAPVLKSGDLVIIESTCPVGTTDSASQWLAEARPDLRFPHSAGSDTDIHVAHSPERVLPGRVLIELVCNDRVVGGVGPDCARRAAQLYRIAIEGECLLTTARTAELVKLSENAYRDVNIAFANELSLVADKLGIDAWEAVRLANHHPRVNILNPGPGVGGHCIAVDPWFIVDSAPELTPLIRTARQVNDGKPAHIANTVRAAAAAMQTRRIACLGLAYKADIDDLRESPSVDVVADLAKPGDLALAVVEPHCQQLPNDLQGLKGVELIDLATALEAADIIVLLTDHRPFGDIDPADYPDKRFIDTRGLWK